MWDKLQNAVRAVLHLNWITLSDKVLSGRCRRDRGGEFNYGFVTFDHLICWKYLDILCTELGTFLPVDVKTCHWFMGNTKKRVNVQLRVICPWKRYFGRDRSAKILNFCWIFPSVTSFDILVENSRHGAIMSDIEWYWYWAEEPAVCWGQERGKESISCGRTSYSRSRLAS